MGILSTILISVLCLIFFINADCAYGKESKERIYNSFKKTIKFLPFPIIIIFLAVIIPTTNQAAAMLVIPKVANSDFAKQAANLPADLTKLAEEYIQEKITDNSREKENGK